MNGSEFFAGTDSVTQTLDGISPIVTPPAGGGALDAAGLAFYQDTSPTAVAANRYTSLPWVHRRGADLLDLSVPTAPTVLVAGVYAVTVNAEMGTDPSVPAAGNVFFAELDLDANGFDAVASSIFPLVNDLDYGPQGTLSLIAYIPLGGVIQVSVQHAVVAGLGFLFEANVQQLST